MPNVNNNITCSIIIINIVSVPLDLIIYHVMILYVITKRGIQYLYVEYNKMFYNRSICILKI